MTVWRLIPLMVVTFAGTAWGPAWAGPVEDARAQELYENGVGLYDEGRYEDAVAAWKSAYNLSRRPLLLYNVANAYERMGLYQDALDELDHYRAYAVADEREALDRRIHSLRRRLDERNSLRATTETTPFPAIETSVSVPLLAPVPANVASPAPVVTNPPVAAALPTLPIPAPPPAGRGRGWTTALFTVGGVGLATGGTFGGLALGARSDAREQCEASGGSTWCRAPAQGAIERDQVFSVLADVGFAVGITGVVGGSIAFGGTRARRASDVAAP